MEKQEKIAQANMETRFRDNPCRGIVLGLNEHKRPVQIAWIMGRSENSKNRVYVVDDDPGRSGTVKTEAADPSKVKDPRLIIYNAMRTSKSGAELIVSNGDQTDTVHDALAKGGGPGGAGAAAALFFSSLETRYCEPDAPNFTPRITGLSGVKLDGDWGRVYISILKASPTAREKWLNAIANGGVNKENFSDGDQYNQAIGKVCGLDCLRFPTIRQTFELPVVPGFGYCITTYKPGSKTLDSFEGEPFSVPLKGGAEEIMNTFWAALEAQWKVSLAGKICEDGKIRVAKPINAMKKI